MTALRAVAAAIDGFNDKIGSWIAWLAVIMVLVQFAVVVLRYVFGIGLIMLQESVVYLHGVLFMVGAGYTLLRGGHVRVDIFYQPATPRTKAAIDLAGALFFLLPVCVLIAIYSFGYIANSWAVHEGSKETSGIQAVYLLKSVILVFTFLVGLQGVSMALHALLVLLGIETTADAPAAAEERV
ncbi:MAG: TRAP transporter small permease subunit [Alphaproteobacteria bacterium]